MSKIAVITARGGSKRIPMKNIKSFCGKPILAYSIETALQSGLFDTVMVSTDSEEIAGVAREYGAEVPFLRSAATADDHATTDDVLYEVIDEYKKRGQSFDYLCCIYPTAPFITPKRLCEAFEILKNNPGTLSVQPVIEFSFPPQRGFYIDENNCITWVQPEHARTRSQDLRKIYHDCGQFYFVDLALLTERHIMIVDDTTKAIIIDQSEAQDIDTAFDWDLAELKYRTIHNLK